MSKNIDEILQQLENGIKNVFTSDNYKNYLDTMNKFYSYSFRNCMLIFLQKEDASCVAGFNDWKNKFDRIVNKGEKAIKIIAPITYKVKNENGDVALTKNGNEMKKMYFKVVNVFDLSQTSGKELPKITKILNFDIENENYDRVMEILKAISPTPIYFENTENCNGYYSDTEKIIVVKDSLPKAQKIKTTIHEISHAILHTEENLKDKNLTLNDIECQAESVAYSVCQKLGIDTSEYSFGYIASWSSTKELKELEQSLDIIKKTTVKIIEDIEKENKKYLFIQKKKGTKEQNNNLYKYLFSNTNLTQNDILGKLENNDIYIDKNSDMILNIKDKNGEITGAYSFDIKSKEVKLLENSKNKDENIENFIYENLLQKEIEEIEEIEV